MSSTETTANAGFTETTTRDVRVGVASFYLPDHSNPEENLYVFGYRVMIVNEGTVPVKLLTRHWIIIDANGDREEVRGPGVVGETPTLAPGKGFKYVSCCPLRTTWGTMEGTYQMQDDKRHRFDVAIGRFILSPPDHGHAVPDPAEGLAPGLLPGVESIEGPVEKPVDGPDAAESGPGESRES